MNRAVMYILIFFAFIDNIYMPINIGMDPRLQYAFFAFGIFYYLTSIHSKITFSKRWLFILALIILISSVISYFTVGSIGGIIQQTILIMLCMLPFYFMFVDADGDIMVIARAYMRISALFASIGLLQSFSKIVHFRPGYDFSYLGFRMGNLEVTGIGRIQSWTQEPSFFAYLIMPAMFISLCRLMKFKTNLVKLPEAIIIVLASLLTFSSVLFIGLLMALLIILNAKYSFLKRPFFFIASLLVIVPLPIILYQNEDVKIRVDDTIKLFSEPDIIAQYAPNLSTYALFSNYLITTNAVKEHPLVGTGIGSYGLIYVRFQDCIPDNAWKRDAIVLNAKDGNSLLMRLLVETGILGTCLILIWIFRTRISDIPHNPELINFWLLSNGIFILLCIRLLRHGHYTVNALWLFLLLYYFARRYFVKHEIK